MKKIVVLFIFLATSVAVFAQSVDNFVVGPYEVDYKGEGDFKFRLRNSIDLYEFYGLKRDTIIQKIEPKNKRVKNGIQVNAFMSLPRFNMKCGYNTFGVDGSWKQQIANVVYVNAGLSMGFSYGKYNYYKDNKPCYREDSMFEIGIPLSVEFTKLDYHKASVYGAIGFTPTIYTTVNAKEMMRGKEVDDVTKDSGFHIAPRFDFGAYVPVSNKNIFRVGVYAEYKINCTGDINIYKERIGSLFVGANIGLVFGNK